MPKCGSYISVGASLSFCWIFAGIDVQDLDQWWA